MSVDNSAGDQLEHALMSVAAPAPRADVLAHLPAAAASSHPVHAATDYFGWFDPLRALLAFAVFISHTGIFPREHHLGAIGAHAVQVFFALSGFLVGGILMRKAQGPASFWAGVPRFYFNRCLRIWAPYYLMIVTFMALVTVRGLWTPELTQRLVPALTYTHNWANFQHGISAALAPINHMWSLGVEEQFYLLCPLLAGLIRDRRVVIVLMGLLALMVPALLGVHYYSCIALGVAAAALHQLAPAAAWQRIQQFGLTFGVPLFCTLVLIGYDGKSPLFSIAATLLVIGCSPASAGTAWTRLLGAMSYSFYLFHWLGLYLAHPLEKRLPETFAMPVFVALALALSLGMSYLSVSLVERPLMNHREMILRRHPWLAGAATAAAFAITVFGVVWIWAR